MRYQLKRELTPETLLMKSDTGEEYLFDEIGLPENLRENYRAELHNQLRKLGKHEWMSGTSGILRYNGIEKYGDGYYLLRYDSDETGLLPYQPGEVSDTIRDLRQIAEWMQQYHENNEVCSGLSLGLLKRDMGGALRMQDPSAFIHLYKLLGASYFYNLPVEVVKGGAWNRKSDVFSWGELAYRLLAGTDPFDAAKPEDRSAKVMEGMVIAPRNLQPRLSERYSKLILECLNPDPQKRPSSEALLKELNTLQEEDQALVSEETARLWADKAGINRKKQQRKERLWLWWRKYGIAVGVAAAILIVVFSLSVNQSHPVITARTKPAEVLRYYFKSIGDVNVSLMDETIHKAKNSFSDVIANIHVINASQQANQLDVKDNAIKISVEGLMLEPLGKTKDSKPGLVYHTKYTVKIMTPGQIQYMEREDRMTLRPIHKVWRITEIKILLKRSKTERIKKEQ